MICKTFLPLSGYLTVSGAIYFSNEISTGLMTVSFLNCSNNLFVSGNIFNSYTSYFIQKIMLVLYI